MFQNGSQLLLTSNQGLVSMISLPGLATVAQFNLPMMATASFSSDDFANMLVFGLMDFSIKIMSSSNTETNMPNAHSSQIVAFEFVNFNGTEIIFSAGKDCMIKAWTFNRQTN